jgi:hypothetical protein
VRVSLRVSGFVLACLLAASIAGYVIGGNLAIKWLQDYSLNGGTTVLGIVLTVVLIDAVIQRNQDRDRNRVRRVAFLQMRIPLLNHLHLLNDMYKAATPVAPSDRPLDIGSLFNQRYFSEVAFLDFAKPAPVSSPVPLQWFDYVRMESAKFRVALAQTVDRYAVFLDGQSVELMETLINSFFLSFLEQGPAIRDATIRGGFKLNSALCSVEGFDDHFRKHTDAFVALVGLFNAAVPAEEKLAAGSELWRNDISPSFGSARISAT